MNVDSDVRIIKVEPPPDLTVEQKIVLLAFLLQVKHGKRLIVFLDNQPQEQE